MALKKSNGLEGFTTATAEAYMKHRIIGLSFGEAGSRKTSFWLEAPGPIAIFSLDQGLEGTVSRVLNEHPDKQIYVWEREWFPNKDVDMQAEAIELRDEYLARYAEVLPKVRTIVVDKETDIWGLFRYAEFGPDSNDAPRNYPALNQRYRKWVNMAKAQDVNLGLIDGMRDQWGEKVNKKTGAVGAASTGLRIRAGFGELDALVHVILCHTGVGPETWGVEVGKVRGPATVEVAGQKFSHEECPSFSTFAQLVFPDSDESEWE